MYRLNVENPLLFAGDKGFRFTTMSSLLFSHRAITVIVPRLLNPEGKDMQVVHVTEFPLWGKSGHEPLDCLYSLYPAEATQCFFIFAFLIHLALCCKKSFSV